MHAIVSEFTVILIYFIISYLYIFWLFIHDILISMIYETNFNQNKIWNSTFLFPNWKKSKTKLIGGFDWTDDIWNINYRTCRFIDVA